MKEITADNLLEFKKRIEAQDPETALMVFKAIKKGLARNYKTVGVFTVLLKEDPLNVYKFKLERGQWKGALKTCMDIFSQNDMFEECIEIKAILSELE